MLLESIQEPVKNGARRAFQTEFRADIQGVRAVAVGAVLAFHFGVKTLAGGFTGVDVFFVLSGYLISSLIGRELEQTSRFDFARFYGRRIRRLLPASMVVLLTITIMAAFVLPPLEQYNLNGSIIATTTYVSNLYFAHLARDYFAPQSASNPLLHTWSLALEEQFYLVWPLFLVWLFKRLRSRTAIASPIMAVTLTSLFLSVFFTYWNQPWAFYVMPLRAWEFGAGALISFGLADNILRSRATAGWLGWIGLAGITVSVACFDHRTSFPGTAALLPVLGTALVLLAGRVPNPYGVAAILSREPFQFVGKISYSLYLWHWPIIVFAAILFPQLDARIRLLALALTLVLSVITYVLVEERVRSNSYLSARPAFSIGAAVVLTFAFAAGCLLWKSSIVRDDQYRRFSAIVGDLPELFQDGCDVPYTRHMVKTCAFGNPAAAYTVVLFGDSHAAQWSPALNEIAKEQRWKVITVIKSSCPSANTPVFRRTAEWQHECDEWREQALDVIARLKPDAVLLGNYGGYGAPDDPAKPISYSSWFAGYRSTLSRLNQNGIPLFLIDDTPTIGFDSPSCLAKVAWEGNGTCQEPLRTTSINMLATRAEHDAGREFLNSHIVGLNDQICNSVYCPLTIGGTAVYRDVNHLTATFVRSLAPRLAAQIVPLIRSRNRGSA